MGLLDWFQGNPLIQQIAQSGRRNREIIGTLLDRPDLPREERRALLSEMSQSKMNSPFMGFGVGNIKAYHGSPYNFSKFSAQNIGSGEGAQAYGHGLYFAENPATARFYQKNLTNPGKFTQLPVGFTIDGKPITNKTWVRMQSDFAQRKDWAGAALSEIIGDATRFNVRGPNLLRKFTRERGKHLFQKTLRDYEIDEKTFWKEFKNRVAVGKDKGTLYEVNIKPDPPDFLDWDKPLSQQSEKVRKALEDHMLAHPEAHAHQTGRDIMMATATGAYKKGADHAKVVSDILRKAGIRGIRYKDAGSRGSEKGTYNYVVFDENDIEILSKK